MDLSAETLQARREWGPIFNILKVKNFQLKISYLAKLSFIREAEINSFTEKQMLRDFVTTRPALQELLKAALNMERKNQYKQQPASIIMIGSDSHITILTINVNRLNDLIKRHRRANWIVKTHWCAVFRRPISCAMTHIDSK